MWITVVAIKRSPSLVRTGKVFTVEWEAEVGFIHSTNMDETPGPRTVPGTGRR